MRLTSFSARGRCASCHPWTLQAISGLIDGFEKNPIRRSQSALKRLWTAAVINWWRVKPYHPLLVWPVSLVPWLLSSDSSGLRSFAVMNQERVAQKHACECFAQYTFGHLRDALLARVPSSQSTKKYLKGGCFARIPRKKSCVLAALTSILSPHYQSKQDGQGALSSVLRILAPLQSSGGI